MKKIKLNYNDTFATTHSRDYYRGKSFHFSGEWAPGMHYFSDDYNIDFVVHDQVLLACAKSHISTNNNKPVNFIRDIRGTVTGVVSNYWDFVLSGIKGDCTGIRINPENKHWELCIDTATENPIWTDTGIKSAFEFSDLTAEEIQILQQPGIDAATNTINNRIKQTTGNSTTDLMSQKAITDAIPIENGLKPYSFQQKGTGAVAGGDTNANGAIALGKQTVARGEYAYAEGVKSISKRYGSHAEGGETTAGGNYAHAEGNKTQATGIASHAEGIGTIASAEAQHVIGKYNISNNSMLEIAGNGSSDSNRSNARTLDTSGNEVLAGKLTIQQPGTGTNDAVTHGQLSTSLEPLSNQIQMLSLGVKLTLSCSPSCIYKNVATNVTVTGSVSKITPDTLSIYVDNSGTATATVSSNNSISTTLENVTIGSTAKSVTLKASYLGLDLTETASIIARYPIYYGFGSSAQDVYTNGSKLSARTSAAITYPTKTATSNNVHFYILVPSDISALNNFTMGGAPYVMNSTTSTFDSVEYKVYESGATYNTNATVSITAN